MRYLILLCATLLAFSPHVRAADDPPTIVPLGGNAYITKTAPAQDELINDTGLHNWTSDQAVASVYFHVKQPGKLELALVGAVHGANHSTVQVSVDGQRRLVALSGTQESTFPVGTFRVFRKGYVKVDLQGVATDGDYYGDISGLQIGGSATAAGTVFADDPANFYWSRRGPSVHLGFTAPANTEYFYSELTVPEGQDKLYTYFMANGFRDGYFGIQVNSPTERRVLFSVWDPPNGETRLVRKGEDVVAQDFGGEGTGGQSYLVYDWKPGQTYRFLTRAQPDGEGNTLYTSWFGTPCLLGFGDCQWKLIATWKQEGTSTYLGGLYSFLETFSPTNSYLNRFALYGNQWAVTTDGRWTELHTARFTVDATGDNQQRLDYAGGTAGPWFYLKHNGFFNYTTAKGTMFDRARLPFKPQVDLETLP